MDFNNHKDYNHWRSHTYSFSPHQRSVHFRNFSSFTISNNNRKEKSARAPFFANLDATTEFTAKTDEFQTLKGLQIPTPTPPPNIDRIRSKKHRPFGGKEKNWQHSLQTYPVLKYTTSLPLWEQLHFSSIHLNKLTVSII